MSCTSNMVVGLFVSFCIPFISLCHFFPLRYFLNQFRNQKKTFFALQEFVAHFFSSLWTMAKICHWFNRFRYFWLRDSSARKPQAKAGASKLQTAEVARLASKRGAEAIATFLSGGNNIRQKIVGLNDRHLWPPDKIHNDHFLLICVFLFFFCETWRPTSEILGWTLSHHIGVADAAWVGCLVWNGCWLIQRHKSLFKEEGRSSLHPFGSCWTRYCSYLLVQVRPALQELSRTAYHRDVNPLVSKLRNSMIVLDSQWYLMILLQNWINMNQQGCNMLHTGV